MHFAAVLTAVAVATTTAALVSPPGSALPVAPVMDIGQLFMVGVAATGPTEADERVLRSQAIGSVMLTGRSRSGLSRTAVVVRRVRRDATHGAVAPFIATDQEGGQVQDLSGPGFSAIPSALRQGSLPSSSVRLDWLAWGRQLRKAGVNLDLAPVLDVVPAAAASTNQPVGRYEREYAHTPTAVQRSGLAAIEGLREAHVAATVKHFPGLGRATGNTDVAARVKDPTGRHDASVAPFRAAVRAGVPFVMVSSAYYPAIDPHHLAAFSATVIGGMLRGDLGFDGVVMSDSMTGAVAVADLAPAERAMRFFAAGGDMLLATRSAEVPAMVAAVRARAATDPRFRAQLAEALQRVRAAKVAAGLVGS